MRRIRCFRCSSEPKGGDLAGRRGETEPSSNSNNKKLRRRRGYKGDWVSRCVRSRVTERGSGLSTPPSIARPKISRWMCWRSLRCVIFRFAGGKLDGTASHQILFSYIQPAGKMPTAAKRGGALASRDNTDAKFCPFWLLANLGRHAMQP